MNESATLEKVEAKKPVAFLPYMCENAPSFKDIDLARSLMPPEGISHTQREIWKWAPKKNKENKIERDEKTGGDDHDQGGDPHLEEGLGHGQG